MLSLAGTSTVFNPYQQGVTENRGPSAAFPLHVKVIEGNIDDVLHLLNQGAHINEPDNEGHTPLHLAAKHGHPKIASLLIELVVSLILMATP